MRIIRFLADASDASLTGILHTDGYGRAPSSATCSATGSHPAAGPASPSCSRLCSPRSSSPIGSYFREHAYETKQPIPEFPVLL
jgi:hypothetical protein